MRLGSPMRIWSLVGAGMLVFGVAFVTSYRLPWLHLPFGTSRSHQGQYQPAYGTVDGPQLVMIYFGSAHCAWSNAKGFPATLEKVKLGLEQEARDHGWSFEAVGVALDWDAKEGLDHLRKFGEFDEVSAGLNWGNALAIKYFGDRIPEPASTPQVLVVLRNLLQPNFQKGLFTYRVNNERLVARKSGLYQIESWISNGLPLPGFPPIAKEESETILQ
jgi:hypothetical protein